jgi:hypothetical protein
MRRYLDISIFRLQNESLRKMRKKNSLGFVEPGEFYRLEARLGRQKLKKNAWSDKKKLQKSQKNTFLAGRLRELALELVTFNNKNTLFFSTLRLALSYLINRVIF